MTERRIKDLKQLIQEYKGMQGVKTVDSRDGEKTAPRKYLSDEAETVSRM